MTEFEQPAEFDPQIFQDLMEAGVVLHNERRYEEALAYRERAYLIAPDGSFEKGRAARDCGASCDRLGRADDAEAWADEAFVAHDRLVRGMGDSPTREAFRERAVSAMYVGVVSLRGGMATDAQDWRKSARAVDYMHQAWTDIQSAKSLAPHGINQRIDQYEINAARRVSMAESLYGQRSRGFSVGARAVGLAFWSESPQLDTSRPNLSPKELVRAKVKAFVGGVAALGVGLLATPDQTTRRSVALKLADKSL